jgi:hypothetical protein
MRQQNAVWVSIGEDLKGAARIGGATATGQRSDPQGVALLGQSPMREPAFVLGKKLERTRQVPVGVCRLGLLNHGQLRRARISRTRCVPVAFRRRCRDDRG